MERDHPLSGRAASGQHVGRRSARPRVGPAAAALVGRPDLWLTALAQWRRLAVPGWWRRSPFLPLPDTAYLAFRLQTQYGDAAHAADGVDLVTYLEWCRRFGKGIG